jgi:hypothetical protein
VLCAGSTLPLAKQSLDEVPFKLSRAVAKLAGITFGYLAFSYWIDNLGFLLREKLAAIFIKPCSWGFQLAGHLLHQLHANEFSGTIHHHAINKFFRRRCRGIEEEAPTSNTRSPVNLAPSNTIKFFWRRCRGKRRLLQGEFHTHILYFVLSFALFYFYLHRFIKNTQKISFLYSCF